ncbi:DUF192 domain-containing protein [Paraglaciecola arctica]|uniref:DUF192 domain-containing protein n=1 Tax=Paraglaciecola arctica TaxID=1128911 RepID=UPI001C0689B3|nr:DUF192 domain-containing protein [Paraglaciecola arctica]MBU3003967.1 DUF192 domain-containing protein [Paraglaciecola arctica]
MRNLFYSLVLFISFPVFAVADANSDVDFFSEISLKIKGNVYTLEYARTFEQRAQGLMHRSSLCENCGMLFQFDESRMAGFWMKNTLIPLDIAFVRADGMITDIKSMTPHDLKTTRSSQRVQYAWEMNQGWFAENGIRVGDTVMIPAK